MIIGIIENQQLSGEFRSMLVPKNVPEPLGDVSSLRRRFLRRRIKTSDAIAAVLADLAFGRSAA